MSEMLPADHYIFGDPQQDRTRLDTQTKLLGRYIGEHARRFFGDDVRSILDVGCGEGQLGIGLLQVYPAAHLAGVDRDAAAIGKANAAAEAQGLNAAFVVGDVEQELPSGPFDLALCSLILLHTQHPERVLQQVYDRLRSGGSIWVIDLAADLPQMAAFGAAYQRLSELLYSALGRMGVHPRIMDELPAMMAATGFVDYTHRETDADHPMITHNPTEASWTQSVGIATIYNARMGIAAATGTPPSTIERLISEVVTDWNVKPVTHPPAVYQVATARKP